MYIYLDNAATTAPAPAVIDAMNGASFFNASALYAPSLLVKNEIERARGVILGKLCSRNGGLVFTSGATESNNMVIRGLVFDKRHHAIVLEGEHSSVYQPAKTLADNGYAVEFAPLLSNGMCDMGALGKLLRAETTLVVFGMCNSDTGVIQDARGIVKTVRGVARGAHIHIDCTQAFCKLPIDVGAIGADSIAISAHKIHGPKGVGGLWVRNGVKLPPLLLGGGQQPMRAGTENNAGVIGFARAVEIFDTEKSWAHVCGLHTRLIEGLVKAVPSAKIVGINNNPYITNIQLPHMGQTVMNALAEGEILPCGSTSHMADAGQSFPPVYVGLGSACTGTAKNRTLAAMGIADKLARHSIRVSFNHENTFEEVDLFLDKLKKVCDNL